MTEKRDELVSVSQVMSTEDGITTFVSPYTGKPVHITGDVDEAMEYAMLDGELEMTPDEDKKLLRKIDLYLLPLICVLYCFQFMDKQTISYASVLGLKTDLKMEGVMYSWAASAFYCGYLVFEFFAVYTLQRFPVIYTVSVYIVLWGVMLCLHAVPKYAGFVVLRVILGGLESAITPAFVIITGQWYKKEEVFLRTAIWVSCNGAGTILGAGAIAHTVFVHADSYSITPWKLIFIITGVLTIALGFAILFHIPNKPTDAWFLTEREKRMVVQRIKTNQQGFGNKHFKKEQFIEAITDYRTWIFFLVGIASCIPNGGLTNFGSILLKEKLGYSTSKTLLMNMPSGAVELVGCIFFAWMYRYFAVRFFWAAVTCAICVAATCMLAFSDNPKVEYAGFALTTMLAIFFIIMLSTISSNVAGHTKKVTVNAIFLIGYSAGNIIGPQTFITSQAPNYMGAVGAMVGCNCVVLLCLLALWADYHFENKRRDAKLNDPTVAEFKLIANHEFADLTDKQNPLFRYIV